VAIARGLWEDDERAAAEVRLEAEERVLERAHRTSIQPSQAEEIFGNGEQRIKTATRVADLAKRPGVSLHDLLLASGEGSVDEEACTWAEVELKYSGYLLREQNEAKRIRELESLALPQGLRFADLHTISLEAREKLSRLQPTTLGQAGRIPGVSPSDLQALLREILRPGVSRETPGAQAQPSPEP